MTLPPLPPRLWASGFGYYYSDDCLRAYAEQAVAAETERCAALCEGVREAADHAARDGHRKAGAMASAALCAKLIRAE